jgi:hypothetical protein
MAFASARYTTEAEYTNIRPQRLPAEPAVHWDIIENEAFYEFDHH